MGFDVTAGLALLVSGHASLAVCCGLYLAWWQVFFNPSAQKPHGARYAAGVACIVGAAALGVAGVTLCVLGVQGLLPPEARGTVKLFKRPVTTELLLFVAWAALELGVLSVLHGAGLMSAPFALGLAALAVAVLLASLVCYVRYYRLEAWPAYVAGIIPLAASGAFAVAMTAVLALMFG